MSDYSCSRKGYELRIQPPLLALLPLFVKTYKRNWDGLGQSKIATCRKHGYYGRHEHPRRFNNKRETYERYEHT